MTCKELDDKQLGRLTPFAVPEIKVVEYHCG
jgi:hypothetical protein